MIDPTTGRHLISGARVMGGPARATVARPEGMASAPSTEPAMSMTPWNPSSPMFWLIAITAGAFGLYGVSTQVRVGPAKAGASIGTA